MSQPTADIDIAYNIRIKLSDGCSLSAATWMPEDANAKPVPAILEYLPYRYRDQTAVRDALNHRYFAACGYACVRVDMRGSGDSEGLLLGEYLQQEQDDALEVLTWIANQKWCTGSIGMIGISWGGFNGLQVAARRPAELKAVISICSTDDRYQGDIHYEGGCQLVDNFTWGASMFAIAPTPLDEDSVGDRWKQLWLDRLESGGTYIAEWHERQHRDEFWDHASICTDYDAIQCPVYLVGGWADPYHSSIFRMLKHLTVPKKALIGPWGHLYPNFGSPGPQIGFLQEAVRWWDKHLKNLDNDIMDEPELRCYLQDTVPPQKYYSHRPGHWVAEPSWPSKNIKPHTMHLAPGRLTHTNTSSDDHLPICSPQTVGFSAGKWLQFGTGPEGPGDQRLDAIGSLVFDTEPTAEPYDLLGAPTLHLTLSSSTPQANLAAILSEVLPDGSATRISYGVLNLTQRDSDRHPTPLTPHKPYSITLQMNECGQRISPGSKLRLALSTTYFPLIWPSPITSALTLSCRLSTLTLPLRPTTTNTTPLDKSLKPFLPPVNGTPLRKTYLRDPKSSNTQTTDFDTGDVTVCYDIDSGLYRNLETNWCYGVHETVYATIHPDDPLSGVVEQRFKKEYGVGEPDLVLEGWLMMRTSEKHFFIEARMDAYEKGERVFGRDYEWKIERKMV